MRIVVCFYLILYFSMAAMLPSQVSKLPALVRHYQHHQSEPDHERLSFAEFLSLHYFRHTQHHAKEDHSDLPMFSSAECNAYFTMETGISVKVNPPAGIFCRTPHGSDPYDYLSCNSVFQPPRIS